MQFVLDEVLRRESISRCLGETSVFPVEPPNSGCFRQILCKSLNECCISYFNQFLLTIVVLVLVSKFVNLWRLLHTSVKYEWFCLIRSQRNSAYVICALSSVECGYNKIKSNIKTHKKLTILSCWWIPNFINLSQVIIDTALFFRTHFKHYFGFFSNNIISVVKSWSINLMAIDKNGCSQGHSFCDKTISLQLFSYMHLCKCWGILGFKEVFYGFLSAFNL